VRPDSAQAPRHLPALLLLAFLTFFLGLGRPAIGDTDEGFYAEAAREMVESGDWLTPHFNYADRWQKPVLYYWLTAATYLVTGPLEWSARFWSALSGVGLVLLTVAIARQNGRRDASTLIAGSIVATCYGYFFIARQALPDLPLTFFMTLTIWAALERRWALAGVAAGLGFLTKGPVALVIPAIVVVPIWWHERTKPRTADLVVAAGAAAIVAFPWYAAMTMTHGTAYLQSFFVGDNLERFATSRFNGPRFILYYLPIVIGGVLPWSMFLLVLPWRRGIDVVRRRQHLTAGEWRLLAWTLAPLIFYTLSIGKQPRYVLPVLPPLAVLLAQSISKRLDEPGRGKRDGALAAASWLTALLFVALAGLLFRVRPLFITAYPWLTTVSIAALFLSAVAIGALATRRAWHRLPVTMAVTSAIALLSWQFGGLSGARPEPVEQMAALVRANRTTEPVGGYQVFVRNLIFYTGVKQTELFNESLALDFIKSPERVLLAVRAQDLARLETISGRTLRRLGAVEYLDPANIKLRTLLWPLPAEDIDTVLLVSNR
jgi:4-amino-4-deoxy-L-arabinose transferase-like glycosyltransferase